MKQLIETFYEAFSRKDAETMISCYHEEIRFQDPAFGELHGQDACDMWRMLCKSAQDLEVEYSGIEADEQKGLASWEAIYTFSRTGNRVHNRVLAKFRFKDGKIIEHADSFNLHVWATQAMGWKGKLFGGMAFFQESVQKKSRGLLKKFQARNS